MSSPSPHGHGLAFRSRLDYWPAGAQRPRTTENTHPAMEFNYVESGSVTYLYGGGILTLPTQRMALFWGIVPHQLLRCDKETRHHWMEIPLASFQQWKLPEKLMARLIAGEMIYENDVSRKLHDGLVFHSWHEGLRSGTKEHQRVVALEVEARVLRLAISSSQVARPLKNPGERQALAFQKIGRIAAYVADHYTEPLRLAEVAREAGLRADYATTLFKKATGLSIMEYVTQHRIAHAKRLLLTTDDKVLDIALEAGFGSSSRFYEAFTEACGQSPQDYRTFGRR